MVNPTKLKEMLDDPSLGVLKRRIGRSKRSGIP
jgi:hypothetical protein